MLGTDLLGIPDERGDDIVDDPGGLGGDQLLVVVGEWVGDRNEGHPGEAEHLRFGPSERTELVTAQHDGGNACAIQLDGVVDTPRRTAASIGDGENHRVAVLKTIHHRFG